MTSVGGLFIVISLLLFIVAASGMMAAVEKLALWGHAALALGILLAGVPFPPWRVP